MSIKRAEHQIAANDFDAEELCVRTEHEGTTALHITNEPSDFIQRFTATVLRSSPDGEVDETSVKVAQIHFQIVAVGAWEERASLIEVFDAESADCLAIFEALYGDAGEVREEFQVSGDGDLMYIEMVEVAPREDVFEIARHALENIVRLYGRGCYGAVYCEESSEGSGILGAFKDRGFVRTREGSIWFLDLGNKRAPLR